MSLAFSDGSEYRVYDSPHSHVVQGPVEYQSYTYDSTRDQYTISNADQYILLDGEYHLLSGVLEKVLKQEKIIAFMSKMLSAALRGTKEGTELAILLGEKVKEQEEPVVILGETIML